MLEDLSRSQAPESRAPRTLGEALNVAFAARAWELPGGDIWVIAVKIIANLAAVFAQ
jgi:hypothetical protein